MVLLSFLAQALTIHSERAGRIESSSRELPSIRGEQPRPTQNVAFPEGYDAERASAFGGYVQLNPPLTDEVELAGVFALVKNEFSRPKAHIRGAADDQLEVTCREVSEELVRSKDILESFHGNTP